MFIVVTKNIVTRMENAQKNDGGIGKGIWYVTNCINAYAIVHPSLKMFSNEGRTLIKLLHCKNWECSIAPIMYQSSVLKAPHLMQPNVLTTLKNS